ncbi:MAG: hypothetical protein GTO14_07545 [Anaerolineales bacterium]|nr:hypothetical protein [Anaerolineales bacterium]
MSKEAHSNQTSVKSEGKTYPYRPSWLDRFENWVERLPGRSWMYYLALGLALAFLLTAIQWRDGSYPVGTIDAFHVWYALFASYFLALLRYLDGTAEAALLKARPALNASEAEYTELRYRLTTSPARPTLLSTLAGVALAALMLPPIQPLLPVLGLSTSPLSIVAANGMFFLFMGVAAAFVYHTMHQLRTVSHIYSTKVSVDLFDLQPLYAFSGLTSRTAVGLIILNSLWFAAAPDLLSQQVGIGFGLFYTLLAVVIFVWPLLGIHRRLVREKQRMLRESSQRFAAAIADLHGRVDAGELQGMGELHHTMTSLELERSALARIPTWPWQPETVRGLVTALFLPAIILVIQFVLERALGP